MGILGIAKDFFQKHFSQYDIVETRKGYKIKVKFGKLGAKLDKAQTALDAQVWEDIKKYMPNKSGNLIAHTEALNKATKGRVYYYNPNVPYGHYQYEGIKYVDPVYHVGAFYSPHYGFWSRRGVKKVPSGEPLFYPSNPKAEAHWNEVAFANHRKQWVDLVRRELKK